MAKDVCEVLGLGNVTEALHGLDEDEKGYFRISEGTSPQGGNDPAKGNIARYEASPIASH